MLRNSAVSHKDDGSGLLPRVSRGAFAGDVEITADCADYVWTVPADRRYLLYAVRKMISTVKRMGHCTPERVEVRLVDDSGMRALNSRFMDCPGPTNVLSFPGVLDMPSLIVVSSAALARECLLYGQQPDRYMLLLLAHGVAHLAGLEHGAEMDNICDACVSGVGKMSG